MQDVPRALVVIDYPGGPIWPTEVLTHCLLAPQPQNSLVSLSKRVRLPCFLLCLLSGNASHGRPSPSSQTTKTKLPLAPEPVLATPPHRAAGRLDQLGFVSQQQPPPPVSGRRLRRFSRWCNSLGMNTTMLPNPRLSLSGGGVKGVVLLSG